MKRGTSLTALLLALTVALVAAPGASGATTLCPDSRIKPLPTLITVERAEASILCLINQARIGAGLPAVRSNPALQGAARAHSTSMRTNGFFAHESADGTPLTDRIASSGYSLGAKSWFVGENIIWGTFSSTRALVAAWMNSPSHQHNILDPRFREVGVGADWGKALYLRQATALVVTTDFGYAIRREKASSKKPAKAKRKQRKRKRTKRGK